MRQRDTRSICYAFLFIAFGAGESIAQAPAAAAPATAVSAPVASVPSVRRYELDAPGKLYFTVATNQGDVKGSIKIDRLDVRGIEGWGRFEIRMVIDPTTVATKDPLLDRHIRREILQAEAGPILLGSNERLAPRARPGLGKQPEDEMFGAVMWLDRRRSGKRLEMRYLWTGDLEKGLLKVSHRATGSELGLRPSSHPFVEVKGPIQLSFQAKMKRVR
jgi:hypothetical protein